jgi:hypothetical protein
MQSNQSNQTRPEVDVNKFEDVRGVILHADSPKKIIAYRGSQTKQYNTAATRRLWGYIMNAKSKQEIIAFDETSEATRNEPQGSGSSQGTSPTKSESHAVLNAIQFPL